MKYNIFTLYILAFLMLGCGADTDTSTPTILETRLVHIQEAKNSKRFLDIKFEVIFSTAPMNLKVEDNVWDSIADWEQHDNIVSLYIRTDKIVCTGNSPEAILCPTGDIQKAILERTFRCTLVWNTGRQNLELKVTIPIELAFYTP